MVSSTKIDRTEKLGITLPISLLQKIDNNILLDEADFFPPGQQALLL
jgi:hypothetical protein